MGHSPPPPGGWEERPPHPFSPGLPQHFGNQQFQAQQYQAQLGRFAMNQAGAGGPGAGGSLPGMGPGHGPYHAPVALSAQQPKFTGPDYHPQNHTSGGTQQGFPVPSSIRGPPPERRGNPNNPNQPGGGPGRKEEDEDAPVMRGASYPGQEWAPRWDED